MGTDLPEQFDNAKDKAPEADGTQLVDLISRREQKMFQQPGTVTDSFSTVFGDALPSFQIDQPAMTPAGKALEEGINTRGKTSRDTMDDALEPSYRALFRDKDTSTETLRELTNKLPQFADKASTTQDPVAKFAEGIAHSLSALASRELGERTGKASDRKEAQRSTESALAVADERVPTLNYAFQRALGEYMRDKGVDTKSFGDTTRRIGDLAGKALNRDEKLDINNPALPLLGALAEGIKGQTGENKQVAEKAYKDLAKAIEEKVGKEKPEDRNYFYSRLRAISSDLGMNDEVKRLTELMAGKGDKAPTPEKEEKREADEVKDRNTELSAQKAKEVATDAAKAIRTGDMDKFQETLKTAFEQSKGDPKELLKFSRELQSELKKDGVTVKFKESHEGPVNQLALHREGSPFGVDFQIKKNGDKVDVKSQAYDWESKRDVDQPATDVVKDLVRPGKSTAPKEVADAAKAVKSGNLDDVKTALKAAFEKSGGDAGEFRKFSASLAKELEKDGYIVKFPQSESTKIAQIAIGHKDKPLAVDFNVAKSKDGDTEVKAQSYNRETRKDVDSAPGEVIKGFKVGKTDDRAENKDDKPKTKERTELEKTAKEIYSAEEFQKFKENLDKFEAHAKENKVSGQEIAKTMKATKELLDAPNTHFSKAERAKLAFQAIRQAGDETSIDQGGNNTCNATVVEKMLYSRQPSKPVEMLRDIAVTGKFKTVKGEEITFKPGELRPDEEGKPLDTEDGKRSFASQITQTALINAAWQTADTRPDGGSVPVGSIRYEKRERNKDDENDTGDRLVDYSKSPAEVISDKGGKPISSPQINLGKMVDMWKKVTGETPEHFAIGRGEKTNKYFPEFGTHVVSSPENLQDMLKKHSEGKDGQRFPIILTLNDVGQLDGKDDGPVGGHVVTIKGIEFDRDGKMMIQIDNQYGKLSDKPYPVDTVFKAMRVKPVKKK